MRSARSLGLATPELAEAWWPLQDVAPSNSRWYADHLASGWWDAGDPRRSRLGLAAALADDLIASLPQDAAPDGAAVLELGCGPGMVLQELAVRTGWRLHGWDADERSRAEARELAPEATIHDVSEPTLPLPAGVLDVVWAPRCFARGELGWAALLAEAHRLLRPGGWLVAVLGGPGAWRWEPDAGDWDEEATGLLVQGLGNPDESGGPRCFVSRWWLTEHWGRGFEAVLLRPAGVAMVHPGDGYGLGVWRRPAGPALSAADLAAHRAGDTREGWAARRQLVMARSDAVRQAERRARVVAAVAARSEALHQDAAVAADPRVRAAAATTAVAEERLGRLRAAAPWWARARARRATRRSS